MLSFLRLSSLNFTVFMMKIDVFEHVFTSAYVLQAAPALYGVRHVEVDVSDTTRIHLKDDLLSGFIRMPVRSLFLTDVLRKTTTAKSAIHPDYVIELLRNSRSRF
jgi:hypothetical protein